MSNNGLESRYNLMTVQEITETLIDYRGKTPTKTKEGVKLITAKIIILSLTQILIHY